MVPLSPWAWAGNVLIVAIHEAMSAPAPGNLTHEGVASLRFPQRYIYGPSITCGYSFFTALCSFRARGWQCAFPSSRVAS